MYLESEKISGEKSDPFFEFWVFYGAKDLSFEITLDIAGYDRKTCYLLSCDILPPPHLLLLLLLTPNKILKKTENRVLLSVSEWGPSTVGRTRKKKN